MCFFCSSVKITLVRSHFFIFIKDPFALSVCVRCGFSVTISEMSLRVSLWYLWCPAGSVFSKRTHDRSGPLSGGLWLRLGPPWGSGDTEGPHIVQECPVVWKTPVEQRSCWGKAPSPPCSRESESLLSAYSPEVPEWTWPLSLGQDEVAAELWTVPVGKSQFCPG